MENGNLQEYLALHQSANRLKLVRTKLVRCYYIFDVVVHEQLVESATGLEFLHKEHSVVHGDMKSVSSGHKTCFLHITRAITGEYTG